MSCIRSINNTFAEFNQPFNPLYDSGITITELGYYKIEFITELEIQNSTHCIISLSTRDVLLNNASRLTYNSFIANPTVVNEYVYNLSNYATESNYAVSKLFVQSGTD